ncbi:hypothetical protein F4804DRAFT_338178 [Jackrogersella minutella]|nr:hypothetical protein F4804DRAFT_338178 [Jackrogersella minutella]
MPERRDQYPVDLAFAVPGECSKRPGFDHQYIYEISPEGFRERCYLSDRIDAPIQRDHKFRNILLQEFLVEHVLPGFAPNIQELFKNKEMRFVQCVQARAPGSKVNVTELANYDTMTLSTITNPNTIPWNSNETQTMNRLYNAHILVAVEKLNLRVRMMRQTNSIRRIDPTLPHELKGTAVKQVDSKKPSAPTTSRYGLRKRN